MASLYPLRFRPVLQDYTWGGRGLAERLGRSLPPGQVAESWEISAHPKGPTEVREGPLAGVPLPQVVGRWGRSLVGRRQTPASAAGRFPLLVKLLDAHQWLSVQVHPDDAWARAHGNDLGKTEMWVVLWAAEGAEILFGLRAGVGREELERALDRGRPAEALHRAPARDGDVFFVPAGTVHAVGPGLILAEIQQTSDTTYRLYDWGRTGDGGRPRPLHRAEALSVLDFSRVEPGPVRVAPTGGGGVETEALVRCPHFATDRLTIAGGAAWEGECRGESFEVIGLLEGKAALEWESGAPLELAAVDWVLLPAELGRFRIAGRPGARLLRVRSPGAEEVESR